MTDKEKLAALLTEFGVGFEEVDAMEERRRPQIGTSAILCREFSAKVVGYSGFYASFEFDDAGKFVQMGVWE